MFNKEKLEAYLREKKITRDAFAESLGVTRAMVIGLIKGRKQPSLALLIAIADEMGCTVDNLIRKGE